MSVTREQLYREVWAEPMTTVAARYKVSSSFLARVCTGLGVPRPARGHWAKLEVGKASPQPVLPDPVPGDALEWSRGSDVPARRHRPLPVAPPARRPRVKPQSPDDPTHHALMVNVQPHFEKVYPGSSFSGANFLRPVKRLIPDIYVTQPCLARALEVANAWFLTLERHGYRVMLAPSDQSLTRPDLDYREEPVGQWMDYHTWRPARPTVAFVGTVAMGMTLYELTEHVDVRYVNGRHVRIDTAPTSKRRPAWDSAWIHKEHMPTGRLAVRAYSPYMSTSWQQVWREKAAGDLETQFEAIVRGLVKAAPAIAAQLAEARQKAEAEHARWLAQHEIWLREERERKRKEAQAERERKRRAAQKTSREELVTMVERWDWTRRLSDFFADAERRAGELDAAERTRLLDRLTRARAMIGGTDALRRFREWQTPEELYPEPAEESAEGSLEESDEETDL